MSRWVSLGVWRSERQREWVVRGRERYRRGREKGDR